MSLKISLDEESSEAVKAMIKKIKSEHPECSISNSELASWALSNFFQNSFEKSKDKIARQHFNPKTFMRNRLKGIDSAEKLEAALLEIRSNLKPTKGKSERTTNGEQRALSPKELLEPKSI